LPAPLQSSFGTQQLSLTCEASELPGVDITPIEYRHHAFKKYIPHYLNYSPLVLTFYCTGQMMEKRFFDYWINQCIPKSSGLVNYRLDNNGSPLYEAQININQYDQAGNLTYFALAQDAFPISLSPLNQNWGDDSIHRLTVTFIFTKWLTGDDGISGLPTRIPQVQAPFVTNFTNILNNALNTITNPAALITPGGIHSAINGLQAQGNQIAKNPFTLIY